MKNPATGAQTGLFYIAETTVGTTPANPAWKPLRYAGGIPQLNREALESNELDGSREKVNFRLGAKSASGTINVELSHLSHNDLIAACLQGAFAADPNDSSALLCKVGGTVKTFSILVVYNDLTPGTPKYDIITGVEFTGFTIQLQPNAIATAAFTVLGRDYAANASLPSGSTFLKPTTTRPYTGLDGTIKKDNAVLAGVTAFNPTNDNSASAEYAIGSGGVAYISYGKANNTFDLTTVFTDYTLFEAYINETITAISLKLELDSNFLEFKFPRCQLMSGSPNPQGEGTIVLPVTVQALRDATVQTSVEIRCNKP